MSNILHVWCDGACSGNPGIGGYAAAAFRSDNMVEYSSGYSEYTTNNRMELNGFIQALKIALSYTESEISTITIHTDSKYVENAINCKWINKWAKKEFSKVKNQELWKEVYLVISKCTFINVEWVKGHSGVFENDLVDRLATEAMNMKRTSSGVIEI
jgi:ribonuclease HI